MIRGSAHYRRQPLDSDCRCCFKCALIGPDEIRHESTEPNRDIFGYFWAMPDGRSTISKIFITSIYVAFFFVQLHLKYAVTNAGSRHAYTVAINDEKSGSQEFIEGKNPQKLNVLLNKRYYPEQPIETSSFLPVVHSRYFILFSTTVPEQNFTALPLIDPVSDRGPPVSTT